MNSRYNKIDRTDKRILKNRLLSLMFDDKKLNSPKDLAILVYETKYVYTKTGKLGTDNKITSTDALYKKIQDQLDAKTNIEYLNSLGAEYIAAYCKIFKCSPDYLLGYTDIKSPNQDIRQSCDYTGLSEEAIKSIRDINHMDMFAKYPVSERIILSNLIASGGFYSIIENIDRYLSSRDSRNKKREKLLEEYHKYPEELRNLADTIDSLLSVPQDLWTKDEREIFDNSPDIIQEIMDKRNELEDYCIDFEYENERDELMAFKLQKTISEIFIEITKNEA